MKPVKKGRREQEREGGKEERRKNGKEGGREGEKARKEARCWSSSYKAPEWNLVPSTSQSA